MNENELIDELRTHVVNAISKSDRGDAKYILALMLVANGRDYTTRKNLYNRFGRLRWEKKNAMDTIFDYFLLPWSEKYKCKFNKIAELTAMKHKGNNIYKIDLIKAEKLAKERFFRDCERIIQLREGNPMTMDSVQYQDSKNPYQKKIAEKCDELKTMLLDKNARYGNSSFEPFGLFKSVSRESKIEARIEDKLKRIYNIEKEMKTAMNLIHELSSDSKTSKDYKDAVRDLIGYMIIYDIVLDEIVEDTN